jgi:hypothetical protein
MFQELDLQIDRVPPIPPMATALFNGGSLKMRPLTLHGGFLRLCDVRNDLDFGA